jgi:hypothetical protein
LAARCVGFDAFLEGFRVQGHNLSAHDLLSRRLYRLVDCVGVLKFDMPITFEIPAVSVLGESNLAQGLGFRVWSLGFGV